MTSPTGKIDRRKTRTRQFLRDALMALIVEKGYEAISIQDIVDRANVARPTFYLHFKDKEELLFTSLVEIYEELFSRQHADAFYDLAAPIESPETIDATDFEHIAAHADFYRVMLSEKGSIAFLLSVMDYLSNAMVQAVIEPLESDGAQPRIPAEFIGSFLAGAQIGVTRWWVQNREAYTPQQMAQMMHFLAVMGMAWALRVQPPESDWSI